MTREEQLTPPPEFYEEMAKDCRCCPACSNPPCDGVCAGGMCDERCYCDDEPECDCGAPGGYCICEGA